MNKPLKSKQVENLPLGYNITGFYPNRKMRRSVFQPNRSTKNIQQVIGGFSIEGIQIIPYLIKQLAQFITKIEALKKAIKPSWVGNGHWDIDPAVVQLRVVNTIKHANAHTAS